MDKLDVETILDELTPVRLGAVASTRDQQALTKGECGNGLDEADRGVEPCDEDP